MLIVNIILFLILIALYSFLFTKLYTFANNIYYGNSDITDMVMNYV